MKHTADLSPNIDNQSEYLAQITQELVKRNWAFIDEILQDKISNTSILFAGCGLGSTIATSAARTGFLKYNLIDGDCVELSNLNRQAYFTDDLGMNKAQALARILQKINPLIKPEVIRSYIDTSDIQNGLLKGYDYIINTVDMNDTYFKLIDSACEENKTILLPLNVGFGGCLIVFNQNSKRIGEIVDTNRIENDIDLICELWANLDVSKLPKYIQSSIGTILDSIDKKGYNPQLGIAANINASLVVTTIVKLLDKQPVPLAPDFITVDAFEPA